MKTYLEVELFWLVQIFLAVFIILFIPNQALARGLNCNTSCNSQCTTEQWWGGDSFDFTCYTACQIWQLPNCYDHVKNELRNDSWGEVGPYLYVAGGGIIAVKNAQTHPVGLPLTPQQKLRLFDIFNHFLSTKDLSEEYAPFIPEFLSRVRIRWDAKMLDELNMEELRKELTTPVFLNLELLLVGNLINWPDFIGSRGQTWGLDIYINFPQGYFNEIEETVLLAHELIHTLQYLKRGSSLHAFGNDYFRGFESSGYNYRTIPMEQEAFAFGDKVRDWLISTQANQVDHWNFELCNKSNVDTIWAAAGHFIAGLSLVPISHSVGWYRLDKGATCTRILTDIRAGDEVWYIATSDPAGIYPTNQWGHNGSKTFCVDKANGFNFESSYRCNGPTEVQIHTFETIEPPPKTGQTLQKELNGGVKHSVVHLCNDYTKKVMVAQLTYEPRNGGWISSFWTPIDPSKCINNDFGITANKVYYYAYSLDGAEWPVAQNPSQVEFCVIPELDIGIFKYDRNHKGTSIN